MISPVLTISEGMKVKKQNNTNIGMVCVVKARVGELKEITSFGVKYKNILVTRHLLNYKEMFLVTLIYIRYVVVCIILFT